MENLLFFNILSSRHRILTILNPQVRNEKNSPNPLPPFYKFHSHE